jgi:hypothetical protein
MTLILAVLAFVAHASASRQVNDDVITCKMVIAERLYLGTPEQMTGAVLGMNASRQVSLTFFKDGNSSNLKFGTFADEMPAMAFSRDDETTTTMMMLSALATGPSIVMGNRRTGERLALNVLDDGEGQAEFSSIDGVRMVISGSGPSGRPAGIVFNSAAGSRVAHATTTDKLANLSLFDNQQHVRTLLGMCTGKNPRLFLYDRAIHPLVEMTIDTQGVPMMKLNDFATGESNQFR